MSHARGRHAGRRPGAWVPARTAATVLLLREGPTGPDVLLLERRHGDGFAAGAWVFPGGAVDPADTEMPVVVREGATLATRAARLRVAPSRVLGWHVAAVRETFEECGVLLASAADGSAPDPDRIGAPEIRAGLVAGTVDAAGFAAWLGRVGLVARLDGLVPYRRIVTPHGSPKRFDTLFLATAAPAGQRASADGVETVAAQWCSPADALAEAAQGRRRLMYPTVRALEGLDGDRGVRTALARISRASEDGIAPVLPHALGGPGSRTRLEPGDEGYPQAVYDEEFPEWRR